MEFSVTEIWLLVGVLLLFAEALGASGVGLFFAAFGCLTVGFLMIAGIVAEDAAWLQQSVAFVLSTALWTAILWKPLRNFYSSKNKVGYKNMVGDTAYVGAGGLSKGREGEATWSGTIMKAQLSPEAAAEKLDAGAAVEIVGVQGATLMVKPRI